MDHLVNKLQTLLKKNSLSVAEAERLAGLKMSALRNILRGQSKKPSADTLLKLSKLFKCNILNLVDEKRFPEIENLKYQIPDFNILLDLTQLIKNYCEENKSTIDWITFLEIQEETHNYSAKNKLKKLDAKFVYWLLSKKID